ncbi:RICIN domain-containing protein [Streptomyces sp. NPDC050485]|uniref:RICIN domain-containing protein n=1 Tax=Streptomyces sp. NPDC050485 TaxID=3365617 RepID=UPI0037A4ECAC
MALRRVAALMSGLMLTVVGVALAPSAYAVNPDIRNKNSGLCLGVMGGSTVRGSSVAQWECNGNADQKWVYEYIGNGFYNIRNVGSNQCLAIKGGSWNQGAPIIQWDCNGNGDQMWYIRQGSGGYFELLNGNNTATGGSVDLCLAIDGARTDWGAPAISWECNGRDDQSWT